MKELLTLVSQLSEKWKAGETETVIGFVFFSCKAAVYVFGETACGENGRRDLKQLVLSALFESW